jgi:formylglycine-generating enzyme required for sulfatase activity
MQPIPLRASALASLSLGTLLAPCFAQTAKPDLNLSVASGSSASLDNELEGLPAFLLKVPGGSVWMGVEPDDFLQSVAEAVVSFRPENAHVEATEKFVKAMTKSISMLGRQKVDVRGFLLGKWPVKNSEYQVYVDQLRAAGEKVRPPFLWWRWGCVDDYNKHLENIRKEFPGEELGPILYWERHGHEFPYKVQDKDGKPTGDLPVTCISWIDANAFAARIGMRLPIEAELTRAMRGDGLNTWPLAPGEAKRVTLNLRMSELKYWDSASRGWVVETGTLEVQAGSDASNLPLTASVPVL